MKVGERLLLAAAIVLALFGLFMILGGIVDLSAPKSDNSVAGDVALVAVLCVLPVVAGVWLFWRTRRGATRRALEARELTVIHLAGQHQGVLTVPQVAAESGMTLEQAKAVLDRLYHKSFNEKSLADSGEMVYRF